MIRSIVAVLLLFLSTFQCAKIPTKAEPALLVISYDAFRNEYLNRSVTPNLNQFAEEGVSAAFLKNIFPTKTFPNHFTIATGLYADSHGVVGNEVFDTVEGRLNYSYELFHYSNKTVPIWTANINAGKHSGCMMWPGTDFEYNGQKCTFFNRFVPGEKWETRVDEALSWFTDPKTPANLVMLYIEEPDAHGHIYGPLSPVITDMVARLDNLTLYIQEQLTAKGLDNRVNVIHLSDHGMIGVTPPHFIYLDNILANDNCDMYGTSPVLQIVPKDATKENYIFEKLTKAAKENGHFKVYNHKTLPERWHANNPRRTGPILAVADIGYGFQDLMDTAKYNEKKYNITITNETEYGVHGYDNEEPTMHAIFMAKGQLFAKGKKVASVNMIDLYNLFCFILSIDCGANDGAKTLDMYGDLFATKPARGTIEREGGGSSLSADDDASLVKWGLIFLLAVILAVIVMRIKQLRKRHAFLRYLERSKHLLSDFENVEDEPLVGSS